MSDFAKRLAEARVAYEEVALAAEADRLRNAEENEHVARQALTNAIREVLRIEVDCQSNGYAIPGLENNTSVTLVAEADEDGEDYLLAIHNYDGYRSEDCEYQHVESWADLIFFIIKCEESNQVPF